MLKYRRICDQIVHVLNIYLLIFIVAIDKKLYEVCIISPAQE